MDLVRSVSVIIAAFNAERTIERAITSALAQPEVMEVLVVDDASTDDTLATAARCDDGSGRLKIIENRPNAGPGACRRLAVERAAGAWLTPLDADDFMLPGRIAALLDHAADADIIADKLIRVRSGEDAHKAVASSGAPRAIDLKTFVRSNCSGANGELDMGFAKPLMRTAFLRDRSLNYRSDMRLGEDYDLYARILAAGAQMLLTPPKGYVSVVTAGSLSLSHGEADLAKLLDCDTPLKTRADIDAETRQAIAARQLSVEQRLRWRTFIRAVKTRDLSVAASCCSSIALTLYILRQLARHFLEKRSLEGPPRRQARV